MSETITVFTICGYRKQAVKHSSAVLHRHPHKKAFLRRGQAYECLNEPYLSLYDMREANKVDPDDHVIQKALEDIKQKIDKLEGKSSASSSSSTASSSSANSNSTPAPAPGSLDPEAIKKMGDQIANMNDDQVVETRTLPAAQWIFTRCKIVDMISASQTLSSTARRRI